MAYGDDYDPWDQPTDPDPGGGLKPKKRFDWRKAAGSFGPDENGNTKDASVANYQALGTGLGALAKLAFAKDGGRFTGPMPALVGESAPEEILHSDRPPELVTKPRLEMLGVNGPDQVVPLTPGPHRISPLGNRFMHSHGLKGIGRIGSFRGGKSMGRIHRFAEGGEVDPEDASQFELEPLDEETNNMPPPMGGPPIKETPPPMAPILAKPPAPIPPPNIAPPKPDLRQTREALHTPLPPEPKLWQKLLAGAVGAAGGFVNVNPYARPVDMTGLENAIKYPGYGRQVQEFNAKKSDLDRSIALEDSALAQKRSQAALNNTIADTGSKIEDRKTKAADREQAERDRLEKSYAGVHARGGVEVAAPSGVPGVLPLDPDEQGKYTLETVAGKTFKVPTPQELKRQQLAAVQTEAIPDPIADYFKMPRGQKVDPEHFYHYLDSFTKAQAAEGKSLPEQVKERSAVASQLGLNSRDAQIYIATGRVERPAVNNINVGGTLTDPALDQAANLYLKTGQMPSLGMGSAAAAARTKIMNRAAELSGSADLAANKATYRAGSGELAKVQSQRGPLMAFERTANKNFDIVEQASKQVDRSGSPLLNKYILFAKGQIAGDQDTAKLHNAVTTAANEYAKVISGATGGVVTDAARKEAEGMLSSAMNKGTITQVLAQMRREMENRRSGFDEQIQEINGNIGGKRPIAKTPSSGVIVTDPNGKAHTFASQAQADAFRAAANIK